MSLPQIASDAGTSSCRWAIKRLMRHIDAEPEEPRNSQTTIGSSCFGQASMGDFDTSGAILSGCNAIEMVLRSRFLVAPSDDPKMLGPLVGVLEQVTQRGVAEMTERAQECHALPSSSELAIVASILPDVKNMKNRFRNPSAHEGGRSVTEWTGFFHLVFADNGIAQRLLAEPMG